MSRKILLNSICFVLLLAFFINSISAITYKQGEVVDIKVPCSYNGTVCSGSASCEISLIELPESNLVVNNGSMTNNNAGVFNFTTTFSSIGEYQQIVFCCDQGDCASDTQIIEVTGSGEGEVPIEWILLLILVVCYALIFIGASYNEYPIVVIGCFVLLAISLYTFVNGFGKFGNTSLIIQLFSGLNFAIGAYVGLQSIFTNLFQN